MRKALENLTHEQLVDLCVQQQQSLTLLRRKVAGTPKRHRWSNEDIDQIIMMLSQGTSVTDIAVFFNVEPNAVYAICHRKKIRVRQIQANARHPESVIAHAPLKLVVNQ